MKFKLALVAFLSIIMAGGALACPDQKFDRSAEFNWILAGRFENMRSVEVEGSNFVPLTAASGISALGLRLSRAHLVSWYVAAETPDEVEMFSFRGVGTPDYLAALESAHDMFVPRR